jgi:hypothetical protein
MSFNHILSAISFLQFLDIKGKEKGKVVPVTRGSFPGSKAAGA